MVIYKKSLLFLMLAHGVIFGASDLEVNKLINDWQVENRTIQLLDTSHLSRFWKPTIERLRPFIYFPLSDEPLSSPVMPIKRRIDTIIVKISTPWWISTGPADQTIICTFFPKDPLKPNDPQQAPVIFTRKLTLIRADMSTTYRPLGILATAAAVAVVGGAAWYLRSRLKGNTNTSPKVKP